MRADVLGGCGEEPAGGPGAGVGRHQHQGPDRGGGGSQQVRQQRIRQIVKPSARVSGTKQTACPMSDQLDSHTIGQSDIRRCRWKSALVDSNDQLCTKIISQIILNKTRKSVTYIETNSRKQSYNKPIPISSPVIQTGKQLSATVSARQSVLWSHCQLCLKTICQVFAGQFG